MLSYSNLHLNHMSLVTCYFSWPNAHCPSPIMEAPSSLCLFLFPSLVSSETPHSFSSPTFYWSIYSGSKVCTTKAGVPENLTVLGQPDLRIQNLTFETIVAPDQPQRLWILPDHTRFLIQIWKVVRYSWCTPGFCPFLKAYKFHGVLKMAFRGWQHMPYIM